MKKGLKKQLVSSLSRGLKLSCTSLKPRSFKRPKIIKVFEALILISFLNDFSIIFSRICLSGYKGSLKKLIVKRTETVAWARDPMFQSPGQQIHLKHTKGRGGIIFSKRDMMVHHTLNPRTQEVWANRS